MLVVLEFCELSVLEDGRVESAPSSPPPSRGGLAGRFDAEHDESVVARELLLVEKFVLHQGRSQAYLVRRVGVPRVAIGLHRSLAKDASSVPDKLLRPVNVIYVLVEAHYNSFR